jgi:penicillin-binding protein 1A
MNETGARAALPIWISFMDQALKNTPIEIFKPPQGITLMKVNVETGLPSDGDPSETIMEAFIDNAIPLEKEDGERGSVSPRTPAWGGTPGDPPSPSGY